MLEKSEALKSVLNREESSQESDTIGLKGKNLIFLISQPRTGSTLLQTILGSHPAIHTTAEPFIMLDSFYGLRSIKYSYRVRYPASAVHKGVEDFLETFPNGEDAYFEGLRRMCSYLYGNALANSGKQYFLDKTPPYYHIIPELHRIFPEAHFIILLRNPLAVLFSAVNCWEHKDWYRLYGLKYDLTKAPYLILEGINLLRERCIVVKYESLLKNPESELQKIYNHIGLESPLNMTSYDTSNLPRKGFGYNAQKEIFNQGKPVVDNLNKWVSELKNHQAWRVADDYIQLLGKDTINQMGYSYEEIQGLINDNRPHWFNLLRTVPMKFLISRPEEYKWEYQFYIKALFTITILGGIRGLVRSIKKY